MVKVSVIVPVYNVEKYLKQCLDSLVNQTLKDIEIIVVNDGSTDSSEDIIKEYVDKYKGIVKYYKKENGGLSDARNYGLDYATGKYVGFVDSDDYVDINMFEKMYEKAKKDDSDIVECNFKWVYPKKSKDDIGIKYKTKKEMIINARVMACNKIYKKELLDKNNIRFTKGIRYEDVEFFYKLVPYVESISFVKDTFYYYIQRKDSIANNQNEKTADIFIALYNVLEYYKEKNLYDNYKEELEFIYTRFLLCSSFRRIVKIKDKNIRKRLLNETWINLNSKFPLWKENSILNSNLDKKKKYILSVNRMTYKLYSKLFRIF